jgi:hypothetical protein
LNTAGTAEGRYARQKLCRRHFRSQTADHCAKEVLSETVGFLQATPTGTMATALQQQLAQIAKKSTDQLDLKAQRAQHSKSLLFDPRVASNQTFETIYQICAEAFQELKENEHLDHIIDSFLGLVSSRLLLRPGLKAVEWLVRRFRYVSATPAPPSSSSNANLSTVCTNTTPSL